MKRHTPLSPIFIAVLALLVVWLIPAAFAASPEENFKDVIGTVKNIGAETANAGAWFASTVFMVLFYAITLGALLWGFAMKAAGHRNWYVWVGGALAAIIGYSLGLPLLEGMVGPPPTVVP